MISVKVDAGDFDKTMATLISNLDDKSAALTASGAIIKESSRYNFTVGGRPDKWTPSKRVQEQGGQTLRGKTGILMNSIDAQTPTPNGIIVGTNVKYAATHQYGAAAGQFGKSKKGLKIPWGTIPARPFMVVQTEDVEDIKEIFEKSVMKDV